MLVFRSTGSHPTWIDIIYGSHGKIGDGLLLLFQHYIDTVVINHLITGMPIQVGLKFPDAVPQTKNLLEVSKINQFVCAR